MSSAIICPPYGITGIEIKNFRGITYTSVDDIPEGTSWIFLTGKNGYGKTCVLQAIYAAILGGHDQGQLLETNNFSLKLKGYHPDKPSFEQIVEQKRDGNVPVWFREKIHAVAYGASRLSIQAGTPSNEAKGRSAPSYSLFHPDGVLLNIENELYYQWLLRSQSPQLISEKYREVLRRRFDTVREALIRLMPNIAAIEVNVDANRVEYVERDEDDQPLPEKRIFEELASGNKSIIALVGDIVIRLFESQPEAASPSDIEGIVIIDEFDLHLHPEWQKKLPGLLSQVFPKVQFIVSTHSPIPFLGAPKNSVFLKVNRTAEEGITVEKLDINIENLTPNLILSSEIFGFTDIFPVTHDPEKRIRTEDTMDEVAFTDLLDKRLKSYFGSEHEQKLKELFKSGK
ncbi:MAG: AAA family ATPase [Saprospiraceae bacterium]